jgi:hypothetical protein
MVFFPPTSLWSYVFRRDREWFAKALPVLEAVWRRVLKGRAEGLCEILDDPPRIEKQIVCEIKGDGALEKCDAGRVFAEDDSDSGRGFHGTSGTSEGEEVSTQEQTFEM